MHTDNSCRTAGFEVDLSILCDRTVAYSGASGTGEPAEANRDRTPPLILPYPPLTPPFNLLVCCIVLCRSASNASKRN